MTSVDEIRQAAEVLLERAKAASDWNFTDERLWVVDYDPSDPTGQTAMRRVVGGADEPWAAYIATMHPGVGLALARWLEDTAAGWVWDDEELDVVDPDGDPITLAESMDSHALTVARLILGEAS